jgi:hypothetical protein
MENILAKTHTLIKTKTRGSLAKWSEKEKENNWASTKTLFFYRRLGLPVLWPGVICYNK